MKNRRHFLKKAGILTTGLTMAGQLGFPANEHKQIIKPQPLKKGDTIGIVAPASAVPDPERVKEFVSFLESKGYKVMIGEHVFERFGYLAGTDEQRASDINKMFENPEVKAIIAARGGWGGARLLELIDYELIKNNPKIIMGYSDVTSLLLGINHKTDLITFHGPVGISDWNKFTLKNFTKLAIKNKTIKLKGHKKDEEDLEKGRFMINGGKATGKLYGGNLTVLCTMIGSEYLPDFSGSILLIEDVGERVYKVDRYLVQLKLAGVLDKVAGIVFSSCNSCDPEEIPEKGFSLKQILQQNIEPLGIPAFFGTMIGHIDEQYTLPIGMEVEINADKGKIKLLEHALKD
ncbi:S66 peptidase family protein [Flexithrix dorotheae]|uniref:S66 peptidase family protein n=1 Tax=Flexithrix dorotheae TaxID=70993 RepID=UPI00039FC63D|nr:LD-carboxypeptidase [Flexithrix dorotheae]